MLQGHWRHQELHQALRLPYDTWFTIHERSLAVRHTTTTGHCRFTEGAAPHGHALLASTLGGNTHARHTEMVAA